MKNTHFFVATLLLAIASLVMTLCLHVLNAMVPTRWLIWALSAAVLASAAENWTLGGELEEALARARHPSAWDQVMQAHEESKATTIRNLSAENRALVEANLSLQASLEAFQDLSFGVLQWQMLVYKARAHHLHQQIELERMDALHTSRRIHRSISL
jgi:hypothetical protein